MRYKIRPSGVGTRVIEEGTRYYDTEYPHEFPIGNYFVDKFKCLPSFFDSGKNKYKMDVHKCFLLNKDFDLIWTYTKPTKDGIDTIVQVFEGENMLVVIKYKGTPKNLLGSLNHFESPEEEESSPDYAMVSIYHSNTDLLNSINKKISKYVQDSKVKSKISLLTSTRAGLSTVEQNIKQTDIDIPLNYGEGFVKVHEKIIEKLNEDRGKGLVLLHGVPGTGKTNYIRHLCGKLKKEVIFLPPFMADNIASPDFITFLLDHTNSILVIEDAEKVVLDREGDGSSRQGVSNLLNITDGLLSDCLSIQILATFNTSRDRIDKALLRKGRLIAEWKFDALNVEDTNKLLKSIGRGDVSNKPMTLTEIYNIDEEVNVVQEERRAIGFGR
jgi:ATP-dependent 26S proteasome regulatory subunit